jgi:DUF1009 family protein
MLAVIAGTGSLPFEACKQLIAQNRSFFIIALFPENNCDDLTQATHGYAQVITPKFYKVGQVLNELKQRKTTHVLFIGKVDKRNLLSKVSFDWLGIKLLASLATKSDTVVMEKALELLEAHGIKVIRQDEILKGLLVQPGILTGNMTAALHENITYGMEIAQKLSAIDIGQTIVVKDKMILAVEAIEGTDECIRRGIELGKTDIVICKAAHPHQNKKMDLPTLGLDTLKNLQPGSVKALAWQSHHTFIAHKELFIERADELGITLVSV